MIRSLSDNPVVAELRPTHKNTPQHRMGKWSRLRISLFEPGLPDDREKSQVGASGAVRVARDADRRSPLSPILGREALSRARRSLAPSEDPADGVIPNGAHQGSGDAGEPPWQRQAVEQHGSHADIGDSARGAPRYRAAPSSGPEAFQAAAARRAAGRHPSPR